jgi:DNA-binding GntR family transcriptional regulator
MWFDSDEQVIPTEILAEHERIVAALERGKHDRALRLLEQHRERSETFLKVLVDAPPAPERGEPAGAAKQ